MRSPMIHALNAPDTILDAVRLFYLSLYESLNGLASVTERGNTIEVAWSDECPESAANGYLVFMTAEEHAKYTEASRQRRQ